MGSLVSVLRGQMQELLQLPPDMPMTDLRQALSNQIQFNKQSALLAYHTRSNLSNILLTNQILLARL